MNTKLGANKARNGRGKILAAKATHLFGKKPAGRKTMAKPGGKENTPPKEVVFYSRPGILASVPRGCKLCERDFCIVEEFCGEMQEEREHLRCSGLDRDGCRDELKDKFRLWMAGAGIPCTPAIGRCIEAQAEFQFEDDFVSFFP